MSDLYARAATALGWSPTDARSVSMPSLRDLVRPVNPDLAQEISLAIQSGAYLTPTAAPKAPPASPKGRVAKDIEGAVRAAQLYIGRGHIRSITTEQKLYRGMMRKIAAVAKRRNMPENDAFQQITEEAKRRGGLQALPGKDI